jgi:hypothetical protein
MQWTLLILWAVIGIAIFEVTASQAGLVTFGERLAGAAPSLEEIMGSEIMGSDTINEK